MTKPQVRLTQSLSDLQGILDLQWENHMSQLSLEEKKESGFVTVRHTLDQLETLHLLAPHVIADYLGQTAGYALAMTKASRNLIPVLFPMFELFETISFREKKISDYDYMSVGQVCVGKEFRGQGLFDTMYKAYRNAYSETYDFAITEIALSNTRSLAAHKRVGFEIIHEYEDHTQPWAIVLWNWK